MTQTAPRLQETALSQKEKDLLVPSLSHREQLHEIEHLNINAARRWAMRGKTLARDDILADVFFRDLHYRMFGEVWRDAGSYRAGRGGAGWEPDRIAEGVRLFLDDAQGWLACATFPVPEVAVRLHHRLIAIRPWTVGNGRHARLLADVIVASQGEAPLTWGARSSGAARPRYIEAMRAADDGDMAALIAFAGS